MDASLETVDVDDLKMGDTCEMATPSKVLVFQEKVQRLDEQHLRKLCSRDEGKVQRTDILFGDGSENYSAVNFEITGSSSAKVTITNHQKLAPIILNHEKHGF